MKYLICPLGSAGDLHPLFWIGRLLKARGHEVSLIVQAGLGELPGNAGLPYTEVGDPASHEAVLADPDIWDDRKGFEVLCRHFPVWAEEMIPEIRRQYEPGRTVVVGGGVNFGARIAAEIDRMPLITVQLQPVAFLGVQEMPLMRAGMEWTLSLPLFLKKALMRFGVWHADRLLAGGINAVRRRHGLGEPVHSVMGRWWLSPDAVLGMFPEWFARPQPDWPPQVRLCRFPLNDEADVRAPEPELEQFLREGSPPLLFTPGSANAHAAAFFREAAKVCARLGRRGVFLSRFPEQIPPGLPPTVRHFHYIPFSQVFPRCAAVIHHGGIGTCAQGLAAGVPQLVNALSHDQPDNGLRLKRLGVGDYLYARHFAAARVAPLLRRLLDSPDAAVACARVRDLMRTQMSPEGTGALIERLVRPR